MRISKGLFGKSRTKDSRIDPGFPTPFVYLQILIVVLVCSELGSLEAMSSKTTHQSDCADVLQVDEVTLTAEEIRTGEQLLADLGYWMAPANDEQSSMALIAFQKVERRKVTGRWTASELVAIRRATRPEPIETGFEHIEIDLARQVLFVVDRASVRLILPVSTGTGKLFTEGGWTRRAITPIGRFTVYRKIEGWRGSALGQLYYPNYITRGIAIHGSHSVLSEPSSFGCIRIPMYAAVQFSKMTPIGTEVIVHSRFNHS
jgi:lipoprotein-anchoring transpeptidase ErfK/SrfK